MEMPVILEATKPLLYETGYEKWPYAYAGSCFPVRWGKNVYIVSAFHCYENHGVTPESTLYPIPTDATQFFGFSQTLRGKIDGAKDLKHHDLIALQVSNELYTSAITDLVLAMDLSDPDNIIELSSPLVSDVWLRGYPFENPAHEVDYDSCKIKAQAYVTNGFISARKSDFERGSFLSVKTPAPEGFSPVGMSGSPVYAMANRKIRFSGVLIEFDSIKDHFLIIDPIVLRELLREQND